jgi:flagellar hook-length control protein FliK
MPPAALATGNLGAIASARSGAAPVDIQLLTDMIQNERTLTRDAGEGLDTFSLPATNTESLQQAKSPNAAELTLSRTIHTPVGSKQWADEIGSRLTVMAEQGKHSASLRLSPEHLGPLEIRIAISDDKASVWFGAAHADTRAAIEHALPRLRELFEAQGMSLTDAGVFQEAPREQPNAPKQAGSLDPNPSTEPTVDLVRMNIGLVDAYA